MSLTLAAAAAAAGENKTTLLRANKAGKVSGNKDEHSPVVYRTRQTPPRLSAADAARPQRSAALPRDGCARGRDRRPASSRGTLARPAVAQKSETSSLPIRLTSQACRVLRPGKRKPPIACLSTTPYARWTDILRETNSHPATFGVTGE